MKKVWLNGWFERNLGDDLFLKILVERYKNTNFYFYSLKNYNSFEKKYKNVKLYKMVSLQNVIRVIKNRIYRILKIDKEIQRYDTKKYDYSVLISGSYFMEKDKYNLKKFLNYLKINVPYYIIGVNFGPYKTEKYYNDFKKIFSDANDVCFRDKYSYNLFNELSNTRYAPDIVFGLDTSKIKITNNKNVIISVCNINKNINNKYYSQEEYEENIIKLICFFSSHGYRCKLMSFSEGEGDEKVIESIMSKYDGNVETYFYRNNIEEALNVLGDSSIIVGTRFHANILGLVLNKTVIPIAYSNKMINILEDINFKGKYFNLNEENGFNINELSEGDLDYKLDVNKECEKSKKHFSKLDEVIK